MDGAQDEARAELAFGLVPVQDDLGADGQRQRRDDPQIEKMPERGARRRGSARP